MPPIRHRRVARSVFFGLLTAAVLIPLLAGCEATMGVVFGPVQSENIAFETLDPGARTNRYLVCPKDYCGAAPDRVSPVFDEAAAVLRQRWLAMIKRQPRVTPGPADETAMQYVFVQRSRFLRFPDTITVRFIALGAARSTLAIYSRSTYGRSDFGVNRDRIDSWLAELAPS